MIALNNHQTNAPSPAAIERMAAEIHQENMKREFDPDEDCSKIDRRGGPKLLLLAIIKNAVNTLDEWGRRHNNFHSRPYEFTALRNNAQLAYRYLMNDQRTGVTSFLCICDETDADAEAIRERVLNRLSPAAIEALFPQATARC